MKDMLGQEVSVGDTVVYRAVCDRSAHLCVGKILRFTPKRAVIEKYGLVAPISFVKVDDKFYVPKEN